MHEKLIYRAAAKYRKWMLSSSLARMEEHKSSTAYQIGVIERKIRTFLLESKKFFRYGIYDREWTADTFLPDLAGVIKMKMDTITTVLKTAKNPQSITPIRLGILIEEFRAVNTTWSEVQFLNNILSVRIKNVRLSDEIASIDFGDFWIHLNICAPLWIIMITAVNPFKEEEESIFHPHVGPSGKLCKGDAEPAITEALSQGRIEDFFTTVERTLKTYIHNDTYAQLDRWYNPKSGQRDEVNCRECNESHYEDNTSCCERCSAQICENCIGSCKGCGDCFCESCLIECESCEGKVCSQCRVSCEGCECDSCEPCMESCPSCSDELCTKCMGNCVGCGDPICHECCTECENCGNMYCPECSNIKCFECEKTTCKRCTGKCNICGVSSCDNCNDKHECLLAEV